MRGLQPFLRPYLLILFKQFRVLSKILSDKGIIDGYNLNNSRQELYLRKPRKSLARLSVYWKVLNPTVLLITPLMNCTRSSLAVLRVEKMYRK